MKKSWRTAIGLPHPAKTIAEALEVYLGAVQDCRSPNTAKAYGQALQALGKALLEHKFGLAASPCGFPEDAMAWFVDALKIYTPATGRLYLSAVISF